MSSDIGAPTPQELRGWQCGGSQPTSTDDDCCDDGKAWSRLMCSVICQSCCTTCTGPAPKINALCFPACPGEEEETPATPDYPVVTPDDAGLSFTTSTYGVGLPIVFGTDLLPCNVFWSSGFQKKTFVDKDGATKFYYTFSFAAGICEGIVNSVLRLWMGDTLLINNLADVDVNGVIQPGPSGAISGFKIDLTDADSPLRNLNDADRKTRVTIFNGSTSQVPYGVMAETEGYEFSPGYRGVAYILFENIVVQESIPSFRVEVASNSLDLYPRLYGAIPTGGGATFGTLNTATLLYDAGYDVFYVGAQDGGPTKRGVVIFDGNTFDVVAESIVAGDPDTSVGLGYDGTRALVLNNGQIVIDDASGGGGSFWTWHPFAGVSIGHFTGGTVLGAHTSTGFGSAEAGGIVIRALGMNGVFTDVMVQPTQDTQRGIGFAEISATGQFTMRAFKNNWIGSNTTEKFRFAYLPVQSTISDKTATFPDGGPTYGQHIYVFSHEATEKESIKVDRVSISAPYSIADPLYSSAVGVIDFDELDGVGVTRSLYRVFTCHSDGTFILVLYAVAGSTATYFVKWNPLTGKIVWKTPIAAEMGIFVYDDSHEILYGDNYAFLDPIDSIIFRLDLSTGTITTLIDDFTAQTLPAPATNGQFYNALEDSLTYLSNVAGKEITKVYLGRANRQTAPIANIVSTLLERVGWNVEETVLDDLQALSLAGYTISNPTSLRTVFSELKQIFKFDIIESNGKIVYKTRGALPSGTIYETDLSNDGGWLKEVHEYDFADTRKINLTYRDLNRDYKNNVQSLILPKYTNLTVDNDAPIDVTVPIVLTSTDAKKLAEILLYGKIIYESSYEGKLPTKYADIDPGDVKTFTFEDGSTVTVRIRDVNIGEDRSVEFTAAREDPDIYRDQVNLFGNIGRYNEDEFEQIPRRVDPLLLPIPFLSEALAAYNDTQSLVYPIYLTLLNTRTATLPNAPVTVTVDSNNPVAVVPLVNYPTWGYVTETLVNDPPEYSTDFASTLRVKIMSTSGLALASATRDNMLSSYSYNLALVGDELVQFYDVVDEGDNVYAFTTFHRSLFGTDTRNGTHKRGEYFVLLGNNAGVLDTGAIRTVYTPRNDGPAKSVITNVKNGNPFQPVLLKSYASLQFRPRTPAAGYGLYSGNDVNLQWQWQARYGGGFADNGTISQVFTDGLLPEFTVTMTKNPALTDLSDPSTYLRRFTQTANTYVYLQADQVADGFDNSADTLYVMVNHSGSLTGLESGPALLFQVGPKGL